jgi:hypothetical protein
VSNLSTYLAAALAVVLVMDHAPTVGIFWPLLELSTSSGEISEPAISVNRSRKGDSWAPARMQRDSRPANAPLEVVDLPTGSTGARRSLSAPGTPANNVTAVIKGEAPARDQPAAQRVLPPGCESAFGRLAAPPLTQVPGRCII